MAATRKVIITCAITGAIHTPSMSPHLPVNAAGDRRRGDRSGRGGRRHRPPACPRSADRPAGPAPGGVHAVPRRDRQRSDCVTTGGAPTMLVAERIKPEAVFKPEVASLN